MINWSLLQTGDPAAALQAGIEHGQEQRRQRDVRGALSTLAGSPGDPNAIGILRSAAPELALRMEDRQYQLQERQREAHGRDLMGQVFAPQGVVPNDAGSQPQMSALAQWANGGGMPDGQRPSLAVGASAASGPAFTAATAPPVTPAPISPAVTVTNAPTTLVDPTQLPPRTDGLRINHDALRQLFQHDPSSALQVQKMVFDADAASFKRMQQTGEVMAQTAYHLSSIKGGDGNPDLDGRRRELAAMAPQLASLGVTAEMLAQTDLSDVGLRRYLAIGRSISDLTRDDRAERSLDWSMEDDRIDNQRADRSESRQDYYRARNDSRSERADRRSAVRFRERDKDRAALAAGITGVRTDTNDLEY